MIHKSESHAERGKKGAEVRWGVPVVASGNLRIGNIQLECHVLKNEERVLTSKSIVSALNMAEGGYKTGDRRLPRFAKGKIMSPFIPEALLSDLENPVKITLQKGGKAYAYPARVLTGLCNAVLEARSRGVLQQQQLHIAEKADVLLRGFAQVGVIGLIDEATGYQYVRERNALATILEQFIAKEAAEWVKTFPDEFYRQMFRLKGMTPDELYKRPRSFGQYTHDIVYKRLAPNIVEELKEKNPRNEKGRRAHCNHQWFTKNRGRYALQNHIGHLLGFMQVSKNWDGFMKLVNEYLPVQPTVVSENDTESADAQQ